MARYVVVLRKSVLKDLGDIPKKDIERIMSAIGSLADNPGSPQARKLSRDDRYRLRQGVYRIIYSIEGDKLIVCVVRDSCRFAP